ncbi:transcription antitermination factor NusB [Dysgonomonas sp. 25]|uniref:transcription antitermination factor NusB n=1 Tax=Dysgonomonas sp. 25 TaxID=2302933 RepID=UPI0013D47BE9|nr:transcription antitermination factor NusB [Dysgonomonas sp. 25]NDV69580.1 transcription antitermination factor NusB [Dysgonomonas sp. 25]
MINRVLIRIRVVQILFACFESKETDLKKAENELLFSLQKSYDLYHYLLSLFIELTDLYQHRIDNRKAKLLPTEEDVNPNTRLTDNRFVSQLRKNKTLQKYLTDRPFHWNDNDTFLRTTLDAILASDIYKEYLDDANDSYDTDREFWRKVLKNIITQTEDLFNFLEDESLYWNDDIDIVVSFVLKTIKRFDPQNGEEQELLPMFRDDTDREFAVKLLHYTLLNAGEYQELVDKYTKNWESERIASMDMVIMQIAIAEIMNFVSIPTSVTLNEYINIAKAYSTTKSASFINGILDAIVKELKSEQKIFKQ